MAPGNLFYIPGNTNAYLQMRIHGKKLLALIDSGSDVSLLPARLVQKRFLIPTQQRLQAANGSVIDLIGSTHLQCQIGDNQYRINFLVSHQIDEPLIGLSWLVSAKARWNFPTGKLWVNGSPIPVQLKPSLSRCRRIAIVKDVNVPPLCEMDVEAFAVIPHLQQRRSQWATQAKQLETGLIVAGTLLPPRELDLVIRVMNPTRHAIQLKKGSRCELDEVEVMDSVPCDETPMKCATISAQKNDLAETVVAALWTNVADDVSPKDKEKLRTLLLRHKSAFSLHEWDLGFTSVLKHEIDTGNAEPVRQTLRRHPLALLSLIDEQVDTMLHQGIIEPSTSDWSSNIVIVHKKDGSPRFCVDYRALNNESRKDVYPLPVISECLDTLGGSKWYSTFDLKSGYHQLALEESSKPKTTFITRKGSFQFKVLPFGVCGGLNNFSRLMGLVLAGLNYEICLVYIDDIILFGPDMETHLARLDLVLTRLSAVNLKLKPSKCQILQTRVRFLGHIITREGVAKDPDKTSAVQNWPVPKKVKEVRAFLGLCSYYRKFLPNFAKLARPLHHLTKGTEKFSWSSECDEAFNQLKNKLTTAPILALPNDDEDYVLDTDASGVSIGAVLSQMQDGQEKVICYGSRVCSLAEQNYDVTRRELLAITYFLKHYRKYLLGRKFIQELIMLRSSGSGRPPLRSVNRPDGYP